MTFLCTATLAPNSCRSAFGLRANVILPGNSVAPASVVVASAVVASLFASGVDDASAASSEPASVVDPVSAFALTSTAGAASDASWPKLASGEPSGVGVQASSDASGGATSASAGATSASAGATSASAEATPASPASVA